MTDDVTNLVDALITKMERMDGDIGTLKQQNLELRKMVSNPASLLQKAGYISTTTPATEDVWGDPLRGDRNAVIEKAAVMIDGIMVEPPTNNEQWHNMEWEDIHAMAETAAVSEGRPVDQ
tara:strand:- start:1204 stop:1563 length:360 start_codon:yes stop_codon:yes gene_type:complete